MVKLLKSFKIETLAPKSFSLHKPSSGSYEFDKSDEKLTLYSANI